MILELAQVTVLPGHQTDFEVALAEAAATVLPRAAGFVEFTAQGWGVERPSVFLFTSTQFDDGANADVWLDPAVPGGLTATKPDEAPRLVLAAAGKGTLKVIGGMSRERPGYPLIGYFASNNAYAAGLKTPKDLAGKRIAVDPAPLRELLSDPASPFNAHKIMAIRSVEDLFPWLSLIELVPAADERVDFESWVRALWPSDQREGDQV